VQQQQQQQYRMITIQNCRMSVLFVHNVFAATLVPSPGGIVMKRGCFCLFVCWLVRLWDQFGHFQALHFLLSARTVLPQSQTALAIVLATVE